MSPDMKTSINSVERPDLKRGVGFSVFSAAVQIFFAYS